MSDFKPCPFCGGTDIRSDSHRYGRISFDHAPDEIVYSMCCYTCGATFPNCFSRESLVKSWNRRVEQPDSAAVELSEAERWKKLYLSEVKMGAGLCQRLIDCKNSKPQRITQHDVWEILNDQLVYDAKNNRRCTFSEYLGSEELRALLAKLNENREPDYKAVAGELLNAAQNARSILLANHTVLASVNIGTHGWEGKLGGDIDNIESMLKIIAEAIAKHEGGK